MWGVGQEYSQDQIGAVALLARRELRGADVGARWGELAGFLKARVNESMRAWTDPWQAGSAPATSPSPLLAAGAPDVAAEQPCKLLIAGESAGSRTRIQHHAAVGQVELPALAGLQVDRAFAHALKPSLHTEGFRLVASLRAILDQNGHGYFSASIVWGNGGDPQDGGCAVRRGLCRSAGAVRFDGGCVS